MGVISNKSGGYLRVDRGRPPTLGGPGRRASTSSGSGRGASISGDLEGGASILYGLGGETLISGKVGLEKRASTIKKLLRSCYV